MYQLKQVNQTNGKCNHFTSHLVCTIIVIVVVYVYLKIHSKLYFSFCHLLQSLLLTVTCWHQHLIDRIMFFSMSSINKLTTLFHWSFHSIQPMFNIHFLYFTIIVFVVEATIKLYYYISFQFLNELVNDTFMSIPF